MLTHRMTIFEVPKEELGRSVLYSLLTHGAILAGFFLLPGFINPKGEMWGAPDAGGGGAISVGIVQNMRGISLPRPVVTTEANIATESKGLGQTQLPETIQKPPELPDPKAFEVEEKKKRPEPRRPEPPARKPPVQTAQVTQPSNRVDFGEGGTPSFNYSEFSTGSGSGGFGLGDGVFGEKYGWYVRQIREIISNNWQKNLVNPNVRTAPRVTVQFEIQRDGSVANEGVKQTSGIPTLDRSALRAVLASRFPPLPGGERRLVVELWFEYSR
ncbi:MAG: TonB family protein [Acidobacteriota bacterium]